MDFKDKIITELDTMRKKEAGSVLLIWPTESVVRRWPIANFKLAKRTSSSWDDAP